MTSFVIAMDSEAECVIAHLAEARETREFGRRVIRGVLKGERVMVVVTGVGKVNAAAGTQFAIQSGAERLVNIGVCGGFEESMHVGDVYEVEKAVQYDFDLSEVNGTEVGVLNGRVSPYFELETRGRYPKRILGSGDRFTNGEEDFPLLRRLKVGLRDMEGAAIAQVAEAAGVPLYSIKCVTDTIGPNATGQYRENLVRCLAILKEIST